VYIEVYLIVIIILYGPLSNPMPTNGRPVAMPFICMFFTSFNVMKFSFLVEIQTNALVSMHMRLESVPKLKVRSLVGVVSVYSIANMCLLLSGGLALLNNV